MRLVLGSREKIRKSSLETKLFEGKTAKNNFFLETFSYANCNSSEMSENNRLLWRRGGKFLNKFAERVGFGNFRNFVKAPPLIISFVVLFVSSLFF